MHLQNGIQAFAKFKRPECTRLDLREIQSQKISQSCICAQIPLPEVQSNPVSRQLTFKFVKDSKLRESA